MVSDEAMAHYGDPSHGGNPGGVNWELLGWRPYPRSFTPLSDVAPALLATVTVPATLKAHYDAIVIGSGAGGGVAAQALTASGRNVLVIERGSAPPTADLTTDHLHHPRATTGLESRTGPPLAGNPRIVTSGGRQLTVDAADPRWGNNAMTLGGGTRVYGAQAWRFAPEDFRMASTYGVPDGSALADWPVTYQDMEPFYTQAERELGVSGAPGSPATEGPRSDPFPMPPMPHTRPASILAEGAARLGLGTLPVPLLINSEEYDGRPACVRCAQCPGFACPVNAKNGAHNTVLVRAARTGRLTTLLESQVAHLVVDGTGTVTGVEVRGHGDAKPWTRVLSADQVILAAGAIETARLLLNSRSDREPHGIGNNHDHVGRHLQGHIYAGALGIFPDDVNDNLGPGPSIATNDFRHHNDGIVGGGMLANEFVPTPIDALSYLQGAGLVADAGEDMHREFAQLINRMQRVVGPVHEVTTATARVTLDRSVTDSLGVPVARLEGDSHPEDRRTQAFLNDRAAQWLEASGATTVVPIPLRRAGAGPSSGQHQAGTARMGHDPATSVLDPLGRVWGHDNLRVVDGSAHVTNGGVNPVLTIFANAMRIMADIDGQ